MKCISEPEPLWRRLQGRCVHAVGSRSQRGNFKEHMAACREETACVGIQTNSELHLEKPALTVDATRKRWGV